MSQFACNSSLRVLGESKEKSSREVCIFKVHDKFIASEAILPVGEQPTIKPTNATRVETVSDELVGQVLGITYSQKEEELLYLNPMRNVAGFAYVESVDADKNSFTLLVPSPAEFPSKLLIQGNIKWTEL